MRFFSLPKVAAVRGRREGLVFVAGAVQADAVHDYLARRDSQWMGHVFNYLGVSVGCIQNHMDFQERKTEYCYLKQ